MDPITVAAVGRFTRAAGAVVLQMLPLVLAFTGGVLWEHRGPQGFPLAIAGESLAVQRDKAQASAGFWERRAIYWHRAYGDWKGAAERCDATRDQEADAAGKAVETDTATRFDAAGQSFNSGYAAGRVAGVLAGRKTCGENNEARVSDPADPLGDLVDGSLFDDAEGRAGGVRDFNGGAYRPRN